MGPRKNLVTSADAPASPEVTAETAAKYPNLTEAQIAALDRTPSDGKTTPGGGEPATDQAAPEVAPVASEAPEPTPDVAAPAAPTPTLEQINAMIAEGVKAALAEREAEAARAAAAEPAPGAVIYRSAPPPPAVEGPLVKVRITKTGHGQVHTGQDDPKTYNWQDEVALPRTVAEALEARSFGEILE